MKFPLSWYVGLRYTRAKRKNHFISFIALASMLGIALGVMVLITVMSVMNGFERELKERILGTVPHVVVGERGDGLSDWQSVAKKIRQDPSVTGLAPFIDSEAMFKSGYGATEFGLMQGIIPEEYNQVSVVKDFMREGSLEGLKAGAYKAVIGLTLAQRLNVWIGDKITVLVLEGSTVSPAGITPRYRRFEVVGLFETKSDIDRGVVFTHMTDAAKVLRKQDKVSAIRVQVEDVLAAHKTSSNLRSMLGDDYFVSDWNRTQGTLFRAIKMEKTMMFVLLTLIVAVAAFNIVSTMVMVVTDKQADIAIMRTLGTSPSSIMKIFMVQGSVNGVFGTILGVAAGVLLTLNLPDIVQWVESSFGVALIPGDVYFIGFLPTQLESSDVIRITLAALFMTILATLYPAWRASKTKPAEALRYE